MDVEQSFISKIIQEGNLDPVLKAGITYQFFDNPAQNPNADAFQWIVDFWSEYDKAPDSIAFCHAYPDFELIEASNPYGFYIDELKKQHRYALLVDGVNSAIDPLKDRDIDTASYALQHALEEAGKEVGKDIEDREFVGESPSWMEYYENLILSENKILGIPSGFPGIDAVTSGFCAGQLVTLVGLPKSMKSTMLLLFNIAAHKHNCTTMFVTFEMTNEEQELRHYAFRANVSYNRLRHGRLTPEEERRLKQTTRTMEAYQPMWFIQDVSSSTTVTGIAAKAREKRPDIIFVDGVYMMESENPAHIPGSPQALTHITRNLKKLARNLNVPIICTTQALSSRVSNARGIELGSIGYASSFAQDSDIIFGVDRTDDDDIIKLKVVAARNNRGNDVHVLVDWEAGAAEEAPPPQENEDKGFVVEDDR